MAAYQEVNQIERLASTRDDDDDDDDDAHLTFSERVKKTRSTEELEAEEARQERSSRIKIIVLVVLGVAVCAAVIAVIVVVVNSSSSDSEKSAYPFNFESMPPLINNTDYFCGPVHGAMDEDVFVFKGIPYAAPPVGKLRWQPPQTLHSTDDCWIDSAGLEAKNYGPKCYQYDEKTGRYEGNEDCLMVNVWSTRLGEETKRCVMVYIHGGGLITGSGHEEDTVPNADLVRSTDCVFVSFNYRLNAFGFLALKTTEQDAIGGNFGFMDQIHALKWVRDNIAAFGGDPNQVTLYGEGSGATSILVLLSSPLAKGLFHRAWLISPAPKVEGTLEVADYQHKDLLKKTGCNRGGHDDKLRCLRGLAPDIILESSPWHEWTNSHMRSLPAKTEISAVLAVIDDKVVSKPIESWADNVINDVPLLIGNAAQEVDDNPGFPVYNDTDWESYDKYLELYMSEFGPSVPRRLVTFYPHETSPEFQLASLISDVRVICPTTEMAKAAAEYFTSPVHRYVITHKPVMPVADIGKRYAFHKIDLYAFLGNLTILGGGNYNQDQRVSDYFKHMIGGFVNGGVISHAWEEFPNSTALLYSGLTDVISTNYHEDVCHYWRINGFFPAFAWTN